MLLLGAQGLLSAAIGMNVRGPGRTNFLPMLTCDAATVAAAVQDALNILHDVPYPCMQADVLGLVDVYTSKTKKQ